MNKFDKVSFKKHVVDMAEVALIVSTYQPTKDSSDLLRIALDSMLKNKTSKFSIWVVDVGSPDSDFRVTEKEYPNVNFIETNYIPTSWEGVSWKRKLLGKIMLKKAPRSGSYANAWTLDFAIDLFKKLDYSPKYFMTLQMDTMFVDKNFIKKILSMFDDKTAAVGVRRQKNLSKKYFILHSLGCMWNYQIYCNLKLSMKIELPNFDVGEKAIYLVVKNGYQIKNLECTYGNSKIIKNLPSRYQDLPGTDRSVDSKGNVIFMHLGRGIPKSGKLFKYKERKSRTTVSDWIKWYKNHLNS